MLYTESRRNGRGTHREGSATYSLLIFWIRPRNPTHASSAAASARCVSSTVSFSPTSHNGKSCLASAAYRAEGQAQTPKAPGVRQIVWVLVRRLWSGWKSSLLLVTPETVVRWHKVGFRLYWAMLSKRGNDLAGRKKITGELRDLIFQMVADNPTWGAPRINGELLKLGFDISERTVSRWMQRAPRGPEPAKRWKIFLQNHREAIAAMDFFTVPTLTCWATHKPAGHLVTPKCKMRRRLWPMVWRSLLLLNQFRLVPPSSVFANCSRSSPRNCLEEKSAHRIQTQMAFMA